MAGKINPILETKQTMRDVVGIVAEVMYIEINFMACYLSRNSDQNRCFTFSKNSSSTIWLQVQEFSVKMLLQNFPNSSRGIQWLNYVLFLRLFLVPRRV